MCEICKSLHEFPWRFFDECSTFLDMMNDIGIDKKQQRYIIKKVINIAIRATYYIFCCRNRNWDSPDNAIFIYLFIYFLRGGGLFCFVFVVGLFVCLFVNFFYFLFFLIIQSQAAFVKCLYVARFTIVHSKTQIKFPLLLLLLFSSTPQVRPPARCTQEAAKSP